MSNGVAEGVPTTDAVVALGKQYGVPTPLATAMSHVLSDGISCAQMLSELFGEGISKNKLSVTSRLQIRPHFQVRSFYFSRHAIA